MKAGDAACSYPGWLDLIEGTAPIVLIAPHGGTSTGNHDSSLTPKVNDLHTAAIARELAARLGASAIINRAMDRNLLDCNRVSQLTESAPWFLDMLADQLERILAAHGRVVVLSIHGWNLVQPRVDIGVGLRDRNGTITPARGASVSVSGSFMDGTLIPLAARFRQFGIAATFGIRYPAGDANNLIQTLTARHANNEIAPLRRLAEVAGGGRIEAVQLELSIALRFPGSLREQVLDVLTTALDHDHRSFARDGKLPRAAAIEPSSELSHAHTVTRRVHAGRLGFEIHDSARRIGILASFDVGAGMTSARVMIMMPHRVIAMYTCEAPLERLPDGIRIGAVDFISRDCSILIGMRAPMLITPDGASYCDIEGALARSSLDESVTLEAEVSLANPIDVAAAFDYLRQGGPEALTPCFGSASGRIVVNHEEHMLDAVGRIGPAMTSLDGAGFKWRRAIWVVFDDDVGERAIELREHGTADNRSVIRAFAGEMAVACPAGGLAMAEATPSRPPDDITASMGHAGGHVISLDGAVTGFVPLVRPGAAGARIFTMLGLARFTMHGRTGAGMFEQSRLLAEDFRFSRAVED